MQRCGPGLGCGHRLLEVTDLSGLELVETVEKTGHNPECRFDIDAGGDTDRAGHREGALVPPHHEASMRSSVGTSRAAGVKYSNPRDTAFSTCFDVFF